MDGLDVFVLDFLLDRGWLTGRDLCRVAQVAKVFGGEAYAEEGVTACRVAHAARRRLADWLDLRPSCTESHLGLLVLVECSLELAPAAVPRGVVLYLWTQESLDGEAPDADHLTSPPALPLCAELPDAASEVAPDAVDGATIRAADAVLLAGAHLIQTAAEGTSEADPGVWGRPPAVRLPGEADTAEVATVNEALEACLEAADRLQVATRRCSRPQVFEARLTVMAEFLRDVGLHSLGETALKRLPSIRHYLEAMQTRQPSTSERLVSWMRSSSSRGAAQEDSQPEGQTDVEHAEQGVRDAKQLVMSLCSLSSSIVARFYAQTYVQNDDTESGEALELVDAAVQICRERLDGEEGLLAEALHHYGVAAASCAQVKGLGAMNRSAAAKLPRAAEIFAAGETALDEAIAIRGRMGAAAADLLLAQSIAARAELYYCAASANQGGAAAFDNESIQSLARRSVDLNRDAIAKMEIAGFGESIECATVMKDLGKVYGFSGSHSEARDYLARSLKIHQQLLGERHVRTTNVERLSRYG